MSDLKSSAISSLKWTTLSAVISMLAKVGQIAILARFLTKADFGLVAIALLFIAFTDIFLDFGLSSAVLYKLDISENEYSSLFWLNIITGVILYLAVALTSPLIADYYHESRLIYIIPVLSLTIIFSSLSRLQRTIQQKKLHFRFISMMEIIGSIILFISSVIFAIAGYGVNSLIYSTVAYSVFIAVVYLFKAIFEEKNIKLHFKINDIKPFLRIGLYQLGSSTLDFFSSQMDVLVISSCYSIEVLGAYSLLKQLAQRVYGFINPIITKVLTPTLSKLQKDKDEVKLRYLQVVEFLSFINFPIYFLMSFASPFIIGILYGHQYVEYSLLLSILCVFYSILSIGNPVGSLQIALGRTDVGFYWTIYRVIGNFIILYLGSFFNIYVCVSFLALFTIFNIWPSVLLLFKKLIDISVGEYLSVQYRAFLISLSLFPLYFLQKYFTNNIIGVISISFLFLCGYIILSYFFNPKLLNQLIGQLKKFKLNQILK